MLTKSKGNRDHSTATGWCLGGVIRVPTRTRKEQQTIMAEMPKSVAVSIELNNETVQQIKQLIREEMAMFAADALTAAVDRRDWWRTTDE